MPKRVVALRADGGGRLVVVHRLQGRPTGVAANEEADMDTVGPWELLIIGLVLVAVFGSSRLPGMARNLGRGLHRRASAASR